MKTVAIAQARMGSTRFPGKVMKPLGDWPVLFWVQRALECSHGVDQVVIATSTLSQDNVIEKWCLDNGVECFRGSESDVLERFYQCAVQYDADVVLRLTCDCPFLDPNVVGQVIQLRKMTGAAYASNQPTWPDGLDVECFTFEALEAAYKEATRPSDRDCVTQYIIRNQDRFPAEYLICPFPGAHKERWVLDTERDYELCRAIARRLRTIGPPSCTEIMMLLDQNPDLRKINAGAIRNERFYEGLAGEQLPPRTYPRSNELLVRATKTIPLAAQTFSKSHLFYPAGASPLFLSHGDGARVFDVDGHDYIDLVSALLPVVLGYRDPDVDEAIRRQLNSGITFSLATKLEAELAELLCSLIPCAEMVQFGKSGTDVTSAAVRLARAYTGKDRILVGGYHGWADWSASVLEKKDAGIPVVTANLSHKLEYGNPKDLELWSDYLRGGIAAVIVEPTHDPDYLQHLRRWCSKSGVILIFDEIQTGFRYAMGGAQEYWKVTPDLACFGKSMGNGMPISALVGKRDLMEMMDGKNGVFFSGTFFGETLSLAAAIATIQKMQRENVIHHIFGAGLRIRAAFSNHMWPTVDFHGINNLLKIRFNDHENATKEEIQSLFTQEMAQKGILALNANCISFAHKDPEIRRIISAYSHTLDIIKDALEKGDIKNRLGGLVTGQSLRKTA